MSCFTELFSCLRSRKGGRVCDSTGVKSLISPPASLIHTSNPSPFPTTGESNSHLPPLPQPPQQAHIVEKRTFNPPDPRGSPASVDYFSDETYAILMKKRGESLAASAALYSDNCTASEPKLDTEIPDISEIRVARKDWDISNNDMGPKPLPRIYTGAMSPMKLPSPSFKASVKPVDPDPSGSFLSLLQEYDPSPVKYTTSFGKSGTYREATLSLSTERRDVNREKQQGISETMGSLNIRTPYAWRAPPGPSGSKTGDANTPENPNSGERAASDHFSEAGAGLSVTSDLYDKKKFEDSSGNTIGITPRREENSYPRQKFDTVLTGSASVSESTTIFDPSNISHLRALVAPSDSNLTSNESLLSYGPHSSNLGKENLYIPSEIGVLEESANLLSSVQDYEPSLSADVSSVYSSEYTSTPSFVGMDGSLANLTFPPPIPDGKAHDQSQNSYKAPDTRLQKKISPGPIFYPPAGRTRTLDIGNILSIYPDRFPHPLQKLRRVTDNDISKRHLGDNSKVRKNSENIQVRPRISSCGAVAIGVRGSHPTSIDASHKECCNQSDTSALQIVSCGLNSQYLPRIEGSQSSSPSKDDSKVILATPKNHFTPARGLRSSISLGGRIRGHSRPKGGVDARRRASTNSLGNRTTPDTENIDENRDTKSRVFGRRLNMSQSLSRLKNKMHPMGEFKHEMNNKVLAGTAVYRLPSSIPDQGRLTLESDSGNGREEEMKCSKGTDESSEGIWGDRTEKIELASDGSGEKVSVIAANPESDLTSYEDCVMLPFSLISSETLGETRSQEKLVKRFPSAERSGCPKEI